MSVKKITTYLSTAAVALALVAASSTAYAVSIEVECEVRGDRSRAKVDGADLGVHGDHCIWRRDVDRCNGKF